MLYSFLSTSEMASVDKGERLFFLVPLIGILLRYIKAVNNYLWTMCFLC